MPDPTSGGSGQKRLSFHALLTQFGPQYLEQFSSAMPERQREVLRRILRCRTPALGGELFGCPDCRQFHYRYHSCNDRHCPLCGATDADHWLKQRRQRLLLPAPYFLVTFTVPDPLRSWIRSNGSPAVQSSCFITGPCIHEFLAIATHPGIYRPPSTLLQAIGFVDSLFASPQLHLLAESPGYFEKLRQISMAARLKGPRIHDARVAALCLHHGVSE
jgi:hypothetical protein